MSDTPEDQKIPLSEVIARMQTISSWFDSLPMTRKELREMEKRIMDSQQVLTTKLVNINAKMTKIGDETRTLLNKVAALLEQIALGTVSPELQTAVDDLEKQVAIVDDLVPDEVITTEP